MASSPREGGKRPVVSPAAGRPRAASTASRHASADPREPMSRGAGARQRVLQAALPVLDTGRVDADVAQLLTAFVTLLEHTPFPRLLAAFIDAAERDPALAALHADLTRRRREPLLVVLARARERGQLPPDLDPEVVTDLLTGPFFYRRFIAHRPIPPDLINDVITRVLTTPRQAAKQT